MTQSKSNFIARLLVYVKTLDRRDWVIIVVVLIMIVLGLFPSYVLLF